MGFGAINKTNNDQKQGVFGRVNLFVFFGKKCKRIINYELEINNIVSIVMVDVIKNLNRTISNSFEDY